MVRVSTPAKDPAAGDTPRRSPRLRKTSTPVRHAPALNFPSPISTIPSRRSSLDGGRNEVSTTMIEDYLMNIERHDDGREFAIPQAPFNRLIKELTDRDGIRWSSEAKKALQFAAENFLVDFFDKMNFVAVCSGMKTIRMQHLIAARYIMGN